MKYRCDYRFPEINENHIERQLSIKFLWTDRTNAIEAKIAKKVGLLYEPKNMLTWKV